MIRHIVLAALLLPPATALADQAMTASYTGYAKGLRVLKLDAGLTLTPQSYAMHLSFQVVGVIGVFVRDDSASDVTGIFDGDTAQPIAFHSSGHKHGGERRDAITYPGHLAHVDDVEPPPATERDVVSAEDAAHSIDTLSAMALLVRQVTRTGHCDGSARTFDGRALSHLTASTVGQETLPKTDRSIYAGPALRCDFTGQELAGFEHGVSLDEQKKPRQGSAWFAPMAAGGPLFPVKIVFDNRVLGITTLYLNSATDGGAAMAASAGSRVP